MHCNSAGRRGVINMKGKKHTANGVRAELITNRESGVKVRVIEEKNGWSVGDVIQLGTMDDFQTDFSNV
jgi:hypothetical protein